MDTYNVLADHIDSIHPELLQEIEIDDLPKGKAEYFDLGSFVETFPKDQAKGWNKYYIWIRVDHEEYSDPEILSATLAHEYGHFLCRTILYPMLFWLGQYMLHKVSNRPLYTTTNDVMTNLVMVVDELLAWALGWGILFQLSALKWYHIKHGFDCWKTYWWRLDP